MACTQHCKRLAHQLGQARERRQLSANASNLLCRAAHREGQ